MWQVAGRERKLITTPKSGLRHGVHGVKMPAEWSKQMCLQEHTKQAKKGGILQQ